MRMTSFAEGRVRTLPYMPSQKPVVSLQLQQQHCSTMPAQPHTSHFIHSRASLQHPTQFTRSPVTQQQIPNHQHVVAHQQNLNQRPISRHTVIPQGHRSFSQRLVQYDQQPVHQVNHFNMKHDLTAYFYLIEFFAGLQNSRK